MAVRTSWSGTISFGLVSVPVGTCGAVSEKDVKFSQFQSVNGELHPVGRREYNKTTDETVTRADITRCFVMPSGTPVPVADQELAALAPQSSKVISIEKFVDVVDVDPLYFARHEYAVPGKGGERPYALLLAALAQTGKAGIGRTVRRSKEHTVLVRAVEGAIVVTFLNYHDEVRSVQELGILPVQAQQAEVDMGVMLINALSGSFQPAEYEDTQRNRVLEMINNKAQGVEPVVVAAPVQPSATGDMMAALQASIAAAAKTAAPAKKAPARKAAPAKKAPAQKRAPRKAAAS